MAAPVNYSVLHKYRCQTGTASQLVSWVICYICLRGKWYFGEGKILHVLNMLGFVQKNPEYQSLVRSSLQKFGKTFSAVLSGTE